MRPVIVPDLLLANFTVDMVRLIVEHNLEESHALEFKDLADGSTTYKIRQAIGSFSNSDGGFVLCGIRDPKDRRVDDPTNLEQRVVGIPQAIQEFGAWVDNCLQDSLLVPAARIECLTTGVGGKSVGVIKVEKSLLGPIGVRKEATSQLEFWKRGEQSKIRMSYDDLRHAFSGSMYNDLICVLPVLIHVGLTFQAIKDEMLEASGKEINILSVPDRLYFSVIEKILLLVQGDVGLTNAALSLAHLIESAEDYMVEANKAATAQIAIGSLEEDIKVLKRSRDEAVEFAMQLIRGIKARYPEAGQIVNKYGEFLLNHHSANDGVGHD